MVNKVLIVNKGYTAILCFLILLILAQSTNVTSAFGSIVPNLIYTAILLIGASLSCKNKFLLTAIFILAFLAIASRWETYANLTPLNVESIGIWLHIIVLTFVSISICIKVITMDTVDVNIISGSITAYILIGLTFALIHLMIGQSIPNAYSFPQGDSSASPATYFYYSIVCLTTLGFGDMTPVANIARNLTMIEAIVGQMFITILIGRLVGISIANQRKTA